MVSSLWEKNGLDSRAPPPHPSQIRFPTVLIKVSAKARIFQGDRVVVFLICSWGSLCLQCGKRTLGSCQRDKNDDRGLGKGSRQNPYVVVHSQFPVEKVLGYTTRDKTRQTLQFYPCRKNL